MLAVVAVLTASVESGLLEGNSPSRVFDFPGGATTASPATTTVDRFLDHSLFWLTVVRTRFWKEIRAIRKLVEFRLPLQRIAFVQGMRLLFSLNTAERRRGRTEFLDASVLKIVTDHL